MTYMHVNMFTFIKLFFSINHLFQSPLIFLGVLAKLWNVTIRFVMSIRLAFRMEQLSSHWMDFDEIWYLGLFKICWENSSFSKIRQK
jgi:hypothetical protein